MASQTWCTPSHWSRSAPVAASTTSQRCSNLMSRMAAPIRARTTLLAPSQPSTNSAYTSCSDLSVRSTNATRIQQSQALSGSGDRRELLGDAETRDDTEDLVIEMHGPGLRIHGGPPIEHEAFDAVLRQQRRCGDARRTGADNDDGDGRHAYFTAVRWVPRSIAPSSVATVASTTSPCWRYLGFLAARLKKAFHLTAGGSNEPMISTGFGGALSAVPTGVPVITRSPALRRWNRESACSACSGL